MDYIPSNRFDNWADLRPVGWVVPNQITAGTLSTANITDDYVYWWPLVVGKNDLRISKLAINVSTAVNDTVKMGIYDTARGLCMPGDLIHNFGSASCNAIALAELNAPGTAGYITLKAGQLYWIACTVGTDTPAYYAATARMIPLGQIDTTPQYTATCWKDGMPHEDGLPASATPANLSRGDTSGFALMYVHTSAL